MFQKMFAKRKKSKVKENKEEKQPEEEKKEPAVVSKEVRIIFLGFSCDVKIILIGKEEEEFFHNKILNNRYLLQHIFSFLSIEEAARAREICKQFRDSLRSFDVIQLPLLQAGALYSDPWVLHHSITITNPLPKRMKIHLKWVDQGWGNKKGEVRLELKRGGKKIVEDSPFGICAHQQSMRSKVYDSEKLDSSCEWSSPSDLLQQIQEGDVLEIWRMVGGGGGHRLLISFFEIIMELPN